MTRQVDVQNEAGAADAAPARLLRILTVCTHNRTRSVIVGALIDRRLRELGVPAAVRTAGTRADGHRPTEQAIQLLRGRGVDVSHHRSTRVSTPFVVHADLIVAAEHDHVVWIAGRWPEAFDRTYTLPELVQLGEQVGTRGGRPIGEWLGAIGKIRGSSDGYIDSRVPEVADPTGGIRRTWDASFASMDDLSDRLVELIR